MPLRVLVVLAVLASAAAYAGSASAAGPANVKPPQISGRPQVGATLTATNGTWDAAAAYTYQWQICDATGNGCVNALGATAQTIVVPLGAIGATMRVVVTATTGGGSTDATSDPSEVIAEFTLTTDHFAVHYSSVTGSAAAITQTQAGDVAAYAERAYAAETADGYPAPASDGARGGDARTDIYVVDLGAGGLLGYAQPDPGPAGYIALNANPTHQKESLGQQTIAHELFHLSQFTLWLPTQESDMWLFEGSAEWMGYRVDGYQGGLDLGPWDLALDCRDPNGTAQCDLEDAYRNGGYSRWPFFEYVAERWGAGFARSILQTGGTATGALSAAIAAKGSSLADTFNDWAVANMTGDYSVTALQTILPPAYGSGITAGTATAPLAPVTVPVNHLSARYVTIRRGSPSASGPCYKATLDLTVTMPSGVAARPYYWWSQRNKDGSKQAAQPFSVNGQTATLSLPWDTCDWGASRGYVSLPNPSTSLDGQDFRISGTLTVDRSEQATATPPPDAVTLLPSADVDASATDAPRISVFGPQLIQLASNARQLRIIVQSSDSGTLKAQLGALGLGSAKLRAGSNDVRYTLPTRALRQLRATSSAASSLTLTPVSTSGAAGQSVVRRVVVQKAKVKK